MNRRTWWSAWVTGMVTGVVSTWWATGVFHSVFILVAVILAIPFIVGFVGKALGDLIEWWRNRRAAEEYNEWLDALPRETKDRRSTVREKSMRIIKALEEDEVGSIHDNPELMEAKQ